MTKCNVCGSTERTKIRDHVRYNIPIKVYQCNRCGLQYLNEHRKLDYDESYRKKYTPIIGKSCTSKELFDIYSRFQRYKIDNLTKYIDINNKILLDIGCSSGYFIKAIESKVKQAYGLEIRKEDITFARNKGLDVRSNLSDFSINYFDIITMFHTLEHMDDPYSFLSELHSYMKDDTKIYISVPNLDDAMISTYKLPEYADWWYEEPHKYYFNEDSLMTLMHNPAFTGKIHYQQRVNLLNHMNWLYLKEQEKSEEKRMSIPLLINEYSLLNTFMEDIDIRYRRLLEEMGISDNLIFVGEKI